MFQNGQKVVVVSSGDERRVIKVQAVSDGDASRYPVVDTTGVSGRDQSVQIVSGGDPTRYPQLRGLATARDTADSVITALSPAAWYRNATDVVSSGGFASIWADYASSDKGLVLPGVNSNYASAPDSAPLDITDDFEIIVRCVANDYTPAAINTLVGKWGSGTEAYRFYIDTTGVLTFVLQGIAAYASTVAPTCTDGTPYWFRVTRVRSTGKINFYQADDSATVPSSWTQVGTEVSGSTSAAASTTAVLSIGAGGTGSTLSGTIYRAIIRSTIGGAAVFDADFSAQAIGTASFTESSSNAATVTINASGASPAHIGKARDLLQGTGTNQPAYAAGVFTFDGADNYMKITADAALIQPLTHYWVIEQTSWTGGEGIVDGNTLFSATILQNPSTPNIRLYAGANACDNAGLAVGTYGIIACVFNGASSSTRVNNNAEATGNAGAGAAGGMHLGALGNLSAFSAIKIKEGCVFLAAHDATTRSSVITALNNALTVF